MKIPVGKTALALFAGFTLFVGVRDHTYVTNYNDDAHYSNVEARNDVNKSRHLSKKPVIKHFEATQPNLNALSNTKKAQMKKAVVIACTKLHNKKSVNKYKKYIISALGNQAGNELINDTKPITTAQGQTIQQSKKLLNLKIGVGKFDDSVTALPMTIYVKYRSTPFVNGSGNTRGMTAKSQTENDVFDFQIITKNRNHPKLVFVDHVHSQNGKDD